MKDKIDLDKLKSNAIKEFAYFNERLNIDLSKEFNFLNEIAETTTIKEIEKIREDMAYNSCLALLSSCQEIINYYSGWLIDTTNYNDNLSELVEKLDAIPKETNKLIKLESIFKEIKNLFTKLKKNQNNLVKQGKLKFWKSIFPTWASIMTVSYLGFSGYLIATDKLEWSIFFVGGWFLILILTGMIIKAIIHPRKKPEILI